MDLATTASGTIGIAKDTINIKSNAPDGYDLYLSMDNNDTDGNRLYKDANNTSSSYLTPTSGTFSSPTPLDTNSWGYALANTTTGLPTAGASFDTTYSTTGVNTNALFAAVPLSGNEQLIQSITTPNSTEGIDTNIYYGVKANTSLPSGSYKGTVTYTAVARTNSSINEQTSVSPSVTTKLEGGELITIATMLSINAADAEEAGKEVSVTIGGQPCTGVSLSNAQDGTLQISCTAPSMATGRYDVGVDIPKYDKFWVIVNGIQYKYSTQELDQVTGGNATATDILNGKTAYVNGAEVLGSMPSFMSQYDTNKTAEQNTQDSGLTWSSDGSTLTIAEGYHTQQQVSGHSGGEQAFYMIVSGGYGSYLANAYISIEPGETVRTSVFRKDNGITWRGEAFGVTTELKGMGQSPMDCAKFDTAVGVENTYTNTTGSTVYLNAAASNDSANQGVIIIKVDFGHSGRKVFDMVVSGGYGSYTANGYISVSPGRTVRASVSRKDDGITWRGEAFGVTTSLLGMGTPVMDRSLFNKTIGENNTYTNTTGLTTWLNVSASNNNANQGVVVVGVDLN